MGRTNYTPLLFAGSIWEARKPSSGSTSRIRDKLGWLISFLLETQRCDSQSGLLPVEPKKETMILRYSAARHLKEIAQALDRQLLVHHNNLAQSKARVPSIMTAFDAFLPKQPKHYLNCRFENNDHEWGVWCKWARQFDEALRKSALEFAHKLMESKCYQTSERNRVQINTILDNTYHAALCLRIAAALNTGTPERRGAMRLCAVAATEQAIRDVRSLSVQSYGVSPEIEFNRNYLSMSDHKVCDDTGSGVPTIGLIGVESQIRFVLVELLQNACKATIAKYGALNVEDDSPTVKVEITPITNNGLEVRVKDNGCGMSPQDRSAALGYFAANFCKSASLERSQWREFGVPFSGLGFGLPRVRIYLQFHGAHFSLEPSSAGVDAVIRFSAESLESFESDASGCLEACESRAASS